MLKKQKWKQEAEYGEFIFSRLCEYRVSEDLIIDYLYKNIIYTRQIDL